MAQEQNEPFYTHKLDNIEALPVLGDSLDFSVARLGDERLNELYGEFADLPDALVGIEEAHGDDIEFHDLVKYRANSKKRWESLERAITQRFGPNLIPEDVQLHDWVRDKLVLFANSGEISQDHRVDHRSVYAIMLWKYLWGGKPSEINRIAASYDGEYRHVQISGQVRQAFLNYIKPPRHTGEALSPTAEADLLARSTRRRGSTAIKNTNSNVAHERELLLKQTYNDSRVAEEEAIKKYQTSEKVISTLLDGRRLIAERLALAAGGGAMYGAFRKVLDVHTELDSGDKEVSAARERLLKLIILNTREHRNGHMPERIALNIEEVKWTILLCGKRFVNRNKKLELDDLEAPMTIGGIRDFVSRINRAEDEQRGKVKKPTPTPDEVELMVLGSLNKLAKFDRWQQTHKPRTRTDS